MHFLTPFLKKLDCDFVIYSPANMIDQGKLVFSINNYHEQVNIYDVDQCRWFDLSDFSSIWYRRPRPFSEVVSQENPDINKFVVDEIRHTTRGVFANFNGLWVNDPYRAMLADYKPYQLSSARSIGFHIPETLLTTSSSEAENFYHTHNGNIIYKALGFPAFKINNTYKVTYTTKIPNEKYKELLHSVENCPSMFQRYIEKRYELRVTVVGSDFYPVMIDSQAHEKSSVDWRRYQNNKDVRIQPTTIPNAIRNKCTELMKKLGIIYGAFDFIIDESGEFIFLEVNPHGQWAWVQKATGLPIAQSIANLLKGRP